MPSPSPVPEVLSTTYPVAEEHCRLRCDVVAMPSGVEATYYYLERSPAVIIVPVTAAGEVVMIRQYRSPVREWCLEVPAGGCHDTGDASAEEVARKELREEIGGEAGEWQLLGRVFSSPAFADEDCHVFIAWGTVLKTAPSPEGTELLETVCLPADDAFRRAYAGEMKTGPCMLALLWSEPHVRARGFLRRETDINSPLPLKPAI